MLTGLDKLIEAAGKGPLTLIALGICVIAIAGDRWIFPQKDKNEAGFKPRFLTWIILILSVIFLILLGTSSATKKTELADTKPTTPTQIDTRGRSGSPASLIRRCAGKHKVIFSPNDKGVIQPGDMGDAGGGTRWTVLKKTWTAPAKITDVNNCMTGRNEICLSAEPDPDDETVAVIIAKTNGGNDEISAVVSWDGPCTKQPDSQQDSTKGSASTTGNQSPAVTGNGNDFDYNGATAPKQHKSETPRKDKP